MPIAPAPMSAPALRRVSTAALVANVLVIFGFGLLSIPGAVMAARARRLAGDPEHPAGPDQLAAAARALRWAWLFLVANLLFYLLLAILVGVVALTVLAGRR